MQPSCCWKLPGLRTGLSLTKSGRSCALQRSSCEWFCFRAGGSIRKVACVPLEGGAAPRRQPLPSCARRLEQLGQVKQCRCIGVSEGRGLQRDKDGSLCAGVNTSVRTAVVITWKKRSLTSTTKDESLGWCGLVWRVCAILCCAWLWPSCQRPTLGPHQTRKRAPSLSKIPKNII